MDFFIHKLVNPTDVMPGLILGQSPSEVNSAPISFIEFKAAQTPHPPLESRAL
jgi:hypothetical protein